MMINHEKYIKRCIELAKRGLGTTYPNPMVGSVIVHNDKIIGEGWHRKAGAPHAEVNAINSVKNKNLLLESTIYVSLEPCSHFGKTPPCSDLIIQHQIPNIVIGTVDPFEEVSGKGIRKLTVAGRNVIIGVLEKECIQLNKRFFTFHNKKRPYIILKWAESLDGFISTSKKQKRSPVWISNIYSRQLTHRWRTEEQGILVGTQTVVDDNPRLDSRDWFGKNPVRIVIDKSKRISKESYIFDNQSYTFVFSNSVPDQNYTTIQFEKIDFDINIAEQITDVLYKHQIQSVIIEGGKQTLQTFIDSGLWDEARVFRGDLALENGTKSPFLEKKYSIKRTILNDELFIFENND